MRNLVSLVSTAGAFLLAATPLLAIGGVAHAQEAQALRIQVTDLDFSRPGATATFDRRVASAADAFCRPGGPAELSRIAACERTVRDEAQVQLQRMRTGADRAPAWSVAAR